MSSTEDVYRYLSHTPIECRYCGIKYLRYVNSPYGLFPNRCPNCDR